MAYPHTPILRLPLQNYHVKPADAFGSESTYDGVYWGIHLGEDIDTAAGTPIFAIGRGRVVLVHFAPGTREKKDWGNIVIVAHKNPRTRNIFFSLYGHVGHCRMHTGQFVEYGEPLGVVGKANSSENGWWSDAHLHFAIYLGPWKGEALRGYWRHDVKDTRVSYWTPPRQFIETYDRPVGT